MNICGKYIILWKKKKFRKRTTYISLFFLAFLTIFGFSNFSEKLNIYQLVKNRNDKTYLVYTCFSGE